MLPKVRAIAPEFYETMPYHTSYIRVALQYIFDSNLGPFSRVDTSELKLKKQEWWEEWLWNCWFVFMKHYYMVIY